MKKVLSEDLAYAVLEAVREIPAGRVASYGQVARMIGREKNARLVGKILSNAEHYGDYPCHRVVNSAGRLAPSFPEQRRLLAEEGVAFHDAHHVDMAKCQMREQMAKDDVSNLRVENPAFRHQRIRTEALEAFGFKRAADGWRYTEDIVDGALVCEVAVIGGNVAVRVRDKETGEEYSLWRMEGATGRFVGRVRQEVEAVASRIAASCCEREVFKSELAHQIADFARREWGEELEYLWQRFPENAVLRRRDTRKWYAAILRLSRRKLGFDSDETVEIIDLRRTGAEARLGSLSLPGYHMNKAHWFTVVLDGTVPFSVLAELLAASRDAAQ